MVGPIVLAYMLIARIVDLVVNGYSGLPEWYLILFGWGTIALIVIVAVVMSLLRWHRSPDDFTAWPPYPDARSARKEAGA